MSKNHHKKNRTLANKQEKLRNAEISVPEPVRFKTITRKKLLGLIQNDRRLCMGNDNGMKSTKNKKKHDGKFRSKHITHNPRAESARAVFGLNKPNAKDKE